MGDSEIFLDSWDKGFYHGMKLKRAHAISINNSCKSFDVWMTVKMHAKNGWELTTSAWHMDILKQKVRTPDASLVQNLCIRLGGFHRQDQRVLGTYLVGR